MTSIRSRGRWSAAPRRSRARLAGRRSSRRAARRAPRRPSRRASRSAARTSSADAVIETIRRSSARGPCRRWTRAPARSVSSRRSSGSRIALAWTRRSSLARWKPNSATRRAEICETAVRDAGAPVLAQAPVDQVELGQQVVGRRIVGVAQPGPERAQPAAIGLVVVLAGRDADQLLVERRVVVDDRRGHPPAARERTHLVPVEPRGERACLLERSLDRLRPRVRIPVEVAADPGAEAERWRRVRQAPAVRPQQRRRGLPEAALEEPEPVPDLVVDPGSPRSHLVGLPEDGDLLGQRVLEPRQARGRQLRVVQLAQQRRNPLMRLQDGAPSRLRRMSGEDELDAHPLGLARQLLLPHPRGVETGEGVLERLARDAALVLVGAPAPEPVVLLGDVRELEEDAERAQDDGLALERQRRDRLLERLRAPRVRRAQRESERIRSTRSSTS